MDCLQVVAAKARAKQKMKASTLDYDPELSPKDSRPQVKSDGSVFTRLYEIAAKSRKSPDSSTTSMNKPIASRSSNDQLSHVRTMMAKHWKTVEKIDKERMKLEEEQMKEIREKPEICPESKTIAEKKLTKNIEDHSKAELLALRHQKAKSEVQIEVIKDSRPISPDQLLAARVNHNLVHTFVTRSPNMATTPSCKVNIAAGTGSLLELPLSEARKDLYGKVADLRNMRQHLVSSSNFDTAEPLDPLDMDFMERGKYWLEKKHSKLKEQTDYAKERALDGCTFKPNISRLKGGSLSVLSTNSTINPPKYANIHITRSPSETSSRKGTLSEIQMQTETSTQDVKNPELGKEQAIRATYKPIVYSSLSPVQVRCSYKTGFNFNRFKKPSRSAKRAVNLKIK